MLPSFRFRRRQPWRRHFCGRSCQERVTAVFCMLLATGHSGFGGLGVDTVSIARVVVRDVLGLSVRCGGGLLRRVLEAVLGLSRRIVVFRGLWTP